MRLVGDERQECPAGERPAIDCQRREAQKSRGQQRVLAQADGPEQAWEAEEQQEMPAVGQDPAEGGEAERRGAADPDAERDQIG
jgi:hypothetical protein